MSDKFYIGRDLVSFSDNGKYKPVSRVTLKVDDENVLTAGDDTGMELVADCPFATQPMVDALLAQFKGHEYHAYEAGAANIDPAAELGDGLTADGRYSVISRMDDDGSGYPSLSAPGEAEMEDEYPSTGPMTQEINRKLAQTYALISKTSAEIRLEVFGEDGPGDTSLRAEIAIELNRITSSISGLINGEQAQSMIDQTLEGIELSVSNGSTSSTISLKAGETVIDSANISFSGFVTYTGLSGGTTTIDGACIKTGTIDADRIDVENLNLRGVISFGDLSDADEIQNQIDNAGGLDADEVYTLITSTLVQAPTIKGGEFYDINEQGRLTLSDDDSRFAWLTFESVEANREIFSVGGTDYGGTKDITIMTFAGQTIMQCYSNTGIVTLGNVEFSPVMLKYLADALGDYLSTTAVFG